jgi:hypothetical protein
MTTPVGEESQVSDEPDQLRRVVACGQLFERGAVVVDVAVERQPVGLPESGVDLDAFVQGRKEVGVTAPDVVGPAAGLEHL